MEREDAATQSLWISGKIPGMNEIIAAAKGAGGRGARYAKLKRMWTRKVWALARVSRLRPVERAFFRFEWREVDRARNPDNIAASKKLILDGLVLAKVLSNDGWKQVAGWTDSFVVDPKPGVLVHIESVD